MISEAVLSSLLSNGCPLMQINKQKKKIQDFLNILNLYVDLMTILLKNGTRGLKKLMVCFFTIQRCDCKNASDFSNQFNLYLYTQIHKET